MIEDKKTIGIRIILIVVCIGVASLCFYRMNESYDPLARYSYVTDENREIILQYLDSDDIDYVITQQIKPDQFMDFIDIPGFEIRNTTFYAAAKKTQDADNEYIVNFVNKYREFFSRDMLEEILTHYSYVDLTTFYENEAVLHQNLNLVTNPSAPYVILNQEYSVYKYVPDSLETVDTIQIRKEAVQDLQSMKEAYNSTMANGQTLTVEKGYQSYETILDAYNNMSETYPDQVNRYMFTAGENEFQLGYTIALQEASLWQDLCLQGETPLVDYQSVLSNLDEASRNKLEWLQENAYRYGFIIRYPYGKESVTDHIYQPFVLRYVGRKTAKKMHDSNACMEEMKFEETLN